MSRDADPDASSGDDALGPILESFVERFRRGERPSIDELAARHPEFADEIRELLPAMVEIEGAGSIVGPRPDERAPDAPARALPFERLGDYRLLRYVGEGGMGTVYEALRESLSSRVALKVMHPRFRADGEYLRRFRLEARSAASLHHTNIVSVFDFGEHGGVCYYAMQFIAGQGLDRVLADIRRLRDPAAQTPALPVRTRRLSAATPPLPPGDRQGEGTASLAPPSPLPLGGELGRGGDAPSTDGHIDEISPAITGPPSARPSRSPTTPTATRLSPAPQSAIRNPQSPTIALGMVTGRFEAPAATVALDAPDPDAPTAAVPSADPSALCSAPPDDTTSSASLVGHTETRYFREVARLGAQVADALAHAHRRGVLHRDIKPSNILLDAAGNAWITDFGLAKFEDGDDLSQSRDLVGTLRYMAPERFRGVSDRRGDVYALGATLYEMLALRPAFSGSDQLRLIQRIIHDPPTPPRQLDRRIPRDLETIVLKAMAKDPKDRFADAGQLADELRRVVENRPIRSRPIPAPERLLRWCRRNPVLAALNALAATLTIAVAVVSTLAADRNARLAADLRTQRDAANRNLLQATISEAGGLRLSRRVGQRFDTLAAVDRAVALGRQIGLTDADRLALRNNTIAALALPDLRVAREIRVAGGLGSGFAVDPRFERYAFRRDDGAITIRRLADDVELLRLAPAPIEAALVHLRFSSDGRFLVLKADDLPPHFVWDLQEPSRPPLRFDGQNHNHPPWSIHPSRAEMALATPGGSISLLDLPSGRELRRLTLPSRPGDPYLAIPTFDLTGDRLAIATSQPSVAVLSIATGANLAELPHPLSVTSVAWNPRRPNVLATACEDGRLYVWNLDTGAVETTIDVRNNNGFVIAYHPDGETLVSRGWGSMLNFWDARTGRKLLERRSYWSPELHFDPSGRLLSVDLAPDGARIFEFVHRDASRLLVATPFRADDTYHGLALHPGGEFLATSGTRGVELWHLPSGSPIAAIPTSTGWHLRFTPSGELITSLPMLLRWPIGAASVGPPELLQWTGTQDDFKISADGRRLALSDYDAGAVVLDLDTLGRRRLGPQRGVRYVAISPDGRRVAAGSHAQYDSLRLYDADTATLLNDFPGLRKIAGVGPWSFTPDGRSLLAFADGNVLLDLESGSEIVRYDRGAAGQLTLMPDGRAVLFDDKGGNLILVETATGRELARLEDPDPVPIERVEIARDGSFVVVHPTGQPYLRLWDLAALRHALAAHGLDWFDGADLPPAPACGLPAPIPPTFTVARGRLDDWPKAREQVNPEALAILEERLAEYPNDNDARHFRGHNVFAVGRHAEALADFDAILREWPAHPHLLTERAACLIALDRHREALADLDLVLGDAATNVNALLLRGFCQARLGDFDAALADLDRILALDSDRGALACNNLAWALSTARPEQRRPEQALALARKAAAADPNSAVYANTLALALVRAGQPQEALDRLAGNDSRSRPSPADDHAVEALALAALGRQPDARARIADARRLRAERPEVDPAFDALLAEAEAALTSP